VRSTTGRLGPFVSGVCVVLVGLVVYAQLSPGPRPLTSADVDQRVASALASQTPPPAYSQAVFGVIAPSLVLISTHGADASDPKSGALGTGVVVTDDGQILTALHVVRDATEITLTFADGSTSPGTVLTTEPAKDIAVVQAQTPPANVPAAVLGNPNVPVGSDAYVVGNPYGLFGSMSAGVISGLGRTFREPGGGAPIPGLIQFDAAVNPGNSGGPLLDRAGHVVGIVIALLNPTQEDVFIGIGLAVPIDVAGAAGGLPPY
jgi:S1-C subfamily serine protease